MAEKRDMSGVLFKNDKEGNPTWADYKGSITVNGEEFWLSAWIKEGAKGKFMSLAVKEKQASAKPASKQSRPAPDDDDGIPF